MMICDFLCCLALAIVSSDGYNSLFGDTAEIYISSQTEFNGLSKQLQTTTNKGIPTKVKFAPGLYYFNDNNELLLDSSKSDIIFTAENEAIFVSDGESYSKKDAIGLENGFYIVPLTSQLNADCTFMDDSMKRLPLADSGWLNQTYHTNIVNSAIEMADSTQGVAKIEIPEELFCLRNKSNDYFKNSRLCYKAQWTDCYRNILYSDSSFIYFELSEHLKNRFKDYVGNMYAWVQKNTSGREGYTPFYVTNLKDVAQQSTVFYDDHYIYFPENVNSVHVCRYKKFLTISNCKGHISIRNLRFCGTATGTHITTYNDVPSTYRTDLISFSHSQYLEISNCRFKLLGGGVVHMLQSKDLVIKDNTFCNNYTDMTARFSGNNQTLVFQHNYIHNPSKIITRLTCLYIDKISKAKLSDNVAIDVSRGFLKCRRGDSVLVSGNEVFNTMSFNKYSVRNLSSDGGAFIYASKNAPMIISDNIIHDFPYNHRYNGIYLDGGTGNVQIIGNLMYNIAENAVYSRRLSSIEKSGHNNILKDNIILGKSLYAGFNRSDEDNACFMRNYLQPETYDSFIKNGATDKGYNIFVETWKIEDQIIRVPSKIYNSILNNQTLSKKVISRFKGM